MEINNDSLVYVKPNLVIEPLIDNWYAWPHLVSPATAALNIRHRHLEIMESYVQSPDIHAAAVKSPKMLGGPFIDYDGKRVDEIQDLIKDTKVKCAKLLQLGEDIATLNQLLERHEPGHSLESLYKAMPDALKGLVELVYDLNNNASFRFFEPLLYETEFYDESLQSFNLFLVMDDDSRSFVLSTPKLPDANILRINLPFKSQEIDELFRMSEHPRKYGEIKEVFQISEADELLFRSFFTTEVPRKYSRYQGTGVLTRYFGHACILTETPNTSILVDPLISYGYEADISRYDYDDLPETIDYVLITHNHQDHILFETLLRIRWKIKHIVIPKSNGGSLQDPGLRLVFEKLGFDNIIELGEMDTIEFSDCSLTGIPFIGEHCDLDIRSKICHYVQFKDTSTNMIFAADSCNLSPELYQRIQKIIGDVDVIFLGMECEGAPLSWLYGPLMHKRLPRDKDQSRRLAGCNFEQSKALIDIFSPKNVFVYAMGLEPWLKYISSIKYTEVSKPIVESDRLLNYCQSKHIDPERLFGEKIIEYHQAELTLV